MHSVIQYNQKNFLLMPAFGELKTLAVKSQTFESIKNDMQLKQLNTS